MNMKRFILTVSLVMATFTCAFAQSETYRNAARTLLELSSSALSPENMKKTVSGTFEATIKAMTQASAASSEIKNMMNRLNKEVFEPYFDSNEFLDDMTGIMAGVLEKEFSETEVKELVKVYSTPEAKAFTQKGSGMIGGVGNFTQDLMPAITSISQGREAPKVEKVDCPAEYRKVFMEYFNLTSASGIQQMESQLAGNTDPVSQKLLTYMKEALPEMTLKMTKDTFTIDDLKVGIKLTSHPLVQRFIKASSSLNEQAMQPLMQKLQSKIMKVLTGE